MNQVYRRKTRFLTGACAVVLSAAIGGCAGLPESEQTPDAQQIELNPECCDNFPVTPRTEGFSTGEARAAEEGEASEQRGRGRARPSINQEGRLPQIGGPGDAKRTPGERAATSEQQDKLVLNYEQAELRDVVEELADILDINLLITVPMAGTVTFRTDSESSLTRADIWPLFRLLLANGNFSLLRRNEFYEVTVNNGSSLDGLALPGADEDGQAPLITQITPLRFVDTANAIELLTPIVEGNGRITAANNINMLAISANRDRLDKINDLLNLVDIDPFRHRGIRLFYLENADVGDVAEELTGVLSMIEGERGTYQVQALKRVNALLVVAPPLRGFKAVERWVAILDAAGSSQQEQMFIYKVKSLKATSIAKTLTEVFKQDDRVLPQAADTTSTKPTGVSRASSSRALGPGIRTKGAQGEGSQPAPAQPKPAPAPAPAKPRQTTASVGVSANLNVVIVADEDTNSLLVRATPRDYQQLLSTISLLDQPPLEAVINVIIAQVTLNDSSTFGVDWKYVWDNAGSFVGTGFGVVDSLLTSDGSSVGLVINSKDGDVTAVLNALASTNKVDVLSRPTILVKNNQEASIKVGSQQPVITAQKSTDDSGTDAVVSNDISYRDTGIELTVKPQINDEGIIHLEIDQALSAIGQNSAVPGFPSFDNQQIQTVAVAADRSIIVIGGLIETITTDQDDYVPILGELPLIGSAFGTNTVSTIRRELILMIVPEIVDPRGGEAFYMAFRQRVKHAAAMMEQSFENQPIKRKTISEKVEHVLIPSR